MSQIVFQISCISHLTAASSCQLVHAHCDVGAHQAIVGASDLYA